MRNKPKLFRYFNFLIFIFLLTGIILGSLLPAYFLFAAIFIFAAFFAYVFAETEKTTLADLIISVLVVSLGALLFVSSSWDKKDKFLENRPEVTIKVNSLPDENYNRNNFLASVLKIEGRKQDFRVRVFDYSKKMEYLGKYRFKANLTKHIYQGRSFYNLWVKKDTEIEKLPLSFWEKLVKKTNYYCLRVFGKNCNLGARNFLAAIFLGRKELIGQEKVFIEQAGLSHLLAISGLHVGLISLILFYFLRFFQIKFRLTLLISSLFLIFYVAVTGFRPSTQRAVIMYLFFASGFFIKRNTEVLNSLGIAGVILLLFSPTISYDIGFQLSFLAVFGIVVGFKFFPYRRHNNFFINYIKQIFLCSFFVILFTLPVVSYYFGKIYLLSIFYNIILIPIFVLILFLNFLLIISSPLTFLAQSFGAVLSWIIHIFQRLAILFGSFSYSYLAYSFSLKGIFIYYTCLFFLLLILVNKKALLRLNKLPPKRRKGPNLFRKAAFH